MKRTLAILLALLVPGAALPQESHPVGNAPPPATPASPQAVQTQAAPPLRVNPKLRKKAVVVYLRDGRTFEGKLVELTDTSLRLRMDWREFRTGKPVSRVEEIPLADVALIERKPSRAWIAAAIAGGAAATVLVLLFLAASSD